MEKKMKRRKMESKRVRGTSKDRDGWGRMEKEERQGGKWTGRKGDRQGGKEIGREGRRQVGREGRRQVGREGRRQVGKGKIARETGRLRGKDKNRDQGTTKRKGEVGKKKERICGMQVREGEGKFDGRLADKEGKGNLGK